MPLRHQDTNLPAVAQAIVMAGREPLPIHRD